ASSAGAGDTAASETDIPSKLSDKSSTSASPASANAFSATRCSLYRFNCLVSSLWMSDNATVDLPTKSRLATRFSCGVFAVELVSTALGLLATAPAAVATSLFFLRFLLGASDVEGVVEAEDDKPDVSPIDKSSARSATSP